MNMRIPCLAALLLAGCLASATAPAAEEEQTRTPAETFAMLDSNGDGFITPDEAEVEPDVATSFEDGDDDDDGQLSLAEFSKMEVVDE